MIGKYGHGKFVCVHRHHGDLILLQFNLVNLTIGCVELIYDLDDIDIVETGQLFFCDVTYIVSIVLVDWYFNGFMTHRYSSDSSIS